MLMENNINTSPERIKEALNQINVLS